MREYILGACPECNHIVCQCKDRVQRAERIHHADEACCGVNQSAHDRVNDEFAKQLHETTLAAHKKRTEKAEPKKTLNDFLDESGALDYRAKTNEWIKDSHRPYMGAFGGALEVLKMGGKVARVGWNGKGMFLFLVPGSTFEVNRPPLLGIYPPGTRINYLPHIDMKTATGEIVPWLASQSDVLAEDWVIV